MISKGQKGFSLIEMAIVIAILAISVTLAITDFIHSDAVSDLKGDAIKLRGVLQIAQIAAVANRSPVVVQFNPQGLPTATQYIVFLDNGISNANVLTPGAANNGIWDGCEVLLDTTGRRFGLPDGACTFDDLSTNVLRSLNGNVQFNPPPANITFGISGNRIQPNGLGGAVVTLQSTVTDATRTVTVTAIGEVM